MTLPVSEQALVDLAHDAPERLIALTRAIAELVPSVRDDLKPLLDGGREPSPGVRRAVADALDT